MKIYDLNLSPDAIEDLKNTFQYIAEKKKWPFQNILELYSKIKGKMRWAQCSSIEGVKKRDD